jgi:hypothetical protein
MATQGTEIAAQTSGGAPSKRLDQAVCVTWMFCRYLCNGESKAYSKELISLLKLEIRLNKILILGSYLTGNTLRLHYKDKPVNAV